MAPRRDHWPADARAIEAQLAASLRQASSARRLAEDHIRTLDRENRALTGAAARLRVTEPRTYSPDAPHSWFVDLYRAKRLNDPEARARLGAHAKETAADAPRRAEARARAAEAAYLAAFTGTAAERRALDAWTAAGRVMFERRAVTTVDGGGGYFVPPAWLIDDYVPAPRADAALAGAVTTMPLPEHCDTVNVPVLATGTGTGAQTAPGAPDPQRDLADSFVTANVRTITGMQDVAAMWLDQGMDGGGGALDRIVYDDLTADARLQLDGNLILGSGINGQGLGLLPPQTTIGTSLAVYAPNGNTSSGQQWYYNGGSGTALGTTVAQCISGVTRARARRPSHLLTHPWVWDLLTAQTDQQSRPYVLPKGPHPVPAGADCPPGVVGHAHGLPVLGDLNVPTTLGGTTAPYLNAVSGVQFAGRPGSGTGASYTPVIPIVADDVYAWLSAPKLMLLQEVLSGTAQYRFQLVQYAAIMVNRYQAPVSGTLPNSGGWTAGAISSYGIAVQEGSNSLLSISGQGF